MVLSGGKVDAMGSHEQLLQTSTEYQKIFIKRFDKSLSELLGAD